MQCGKQQERAYFLTPYEIVLLSLRHTSNIVIYKHYVDAYGLILLVPRVPCA